MNEQTQTHAQSVELAAKQTTIEDMKHSVLIVSLLINLGVAVSWLLVRAAAGTL